MISQYEIQGTQLISTENSDHAEWINIISPTAEEVSMLLKRFDLPHYIFEDIADIDERARVEIDDPWTIYIFRAPIFNSGNSVPYTTFPIGIVISSTHIITLSNKENEILGDFFAMKVKNFQPKLHLKFLLQIMLRTTKLYLKHLKEIQRQTAQIEEELQNSLENSDLHRLLDFKKSLVFFTTSLKSNEVVIERLQRPKSGLTEEEIDIMEDITIEHKQAIDMANIYTNILTGMLETFASIISNNLNSVMKILTVVTIILTIPTLIASIYGMNVALPLQNVSWAFLVIVAIALGLSGVAFWFLKRKKLY